MKLIISMSNKHVCPCSSIALILMDGGYLFCFDLSASLNASALHIKQPMPRATAAPVTEVNPLSTWSLT